MSFGKGFITQVAKSIFFSDSAFTSKNAQDAIIEARNTAEGFPRAGLALVQNGTQGNNDWVSYSNLTPDAKITFPVKTRINEVTWANQKTSVEFDLEFYKNGTTAGDIVYTYSVSSGGLDYGSQDSVNIEFDVGDWLRIKYKDQGTNTSDLVVVLYFSRIN